MSDLREKFEKLAGKPEAMIYWDDGSKQYLPNTCASDDGHQLHNMTKRAAYFFTQRLNDFMAGANIDKGPTHYAVIDEHGEIAHAVRIKSFTDAKQDCERYKGLMCNITPQAKDWTVKGVTVHE